MHNDISDVVSLNKGNIINASQFFENAHQNVCFIVVGKLSVQIDGQEIAMLTKNCSFREYEYEDAKCNVWNIFSDI